MSTSVEKQLILDKVPSVLHAVFQKRWLSESKVIFHVLLGTCERKQSDFL